MSKSQTRSKPGAPLGEAQSLECVGFDEPALPESDDPAEMVPSVNENPSKYDFSIDSYSHNISMYKKYLSNLRNKPCRLLEIGTFEGASTVWLLDNICTHKDSIIDTIDVWEQPKLKVNLIASGHQGKIKFHLGRSVDILRALPLDSYDFAIIDGSHWTLNVLEDMVHAFRLLKVGGIMESDDYLWDDPEWNQEGTPKAAIDAFLSIYAPKLEILRNDGLVWVRKIADPIWNL